MTAAQQLPSCVEFETALASLSVIAGERGLGIGPLTDDTTALVAEFVGSLIEANPGLTEYLRTRLADCPEVAGARELPLSELKSALNTTAASRPTAWTLSGGAS